MSTAIHFGNRHLSGDELRSRAQRVAGGLRALGLGQGQVQRGVENQGGNRSDESDASLDPAGAVALFLRNDLAFFEATAGCRLAGACVVPVNWHLTPAELAYVLSDCDARVLVVHADLLPRVLPALPHDCRVLVVDTPPELATVYGQNSPAAPAQSPPAGESWSRWVAAQTPLTIPADPPGSNMLYTSGTTGNPKGVRRAPMSGQVLADYYASVTHGFGLRRGMRGLITGPMYHSSPYAHAHVGVWLEAEQWIMARFDPEALLALVETHRITHMHLVPTMFVRLLRLPRAVRERYDLSSLECVCHGAAPCPISVKHEMLHWWGPVIREYYGSTEASVLTAVDAAEWLARPGTVGPARPGVTLEIRDDDGRPVAPGVEGEIWGKLAGAPAFDYHRRPGERASIEREGLLTNGDVGVLDDEGYLYIRDRKRDMIISGGVNIYPAEIEGVLMAHPDVADCAVFGIPDEEFGEAVAAAVQASPGTVPDPGALTRFLEARLARFKVPRVIQVHADLPRFDNGKIYKRRLRDPYWQDAGRQI